MEKFLEIYSKYRDYILSLFLFVVFLSVQAFVFWYFSNDINHIKQDMKGKQVSESKAKSKNETLFIVDIKGEVKKPGVYFLDEGKRVIDVVKKAGGFTVDADTSANNLSKKIFDEMVIVIYSQSEIRDFVSTKEKGESLKEICNDGVIANDACVSNVNDKEKDKEKFSSGNSNSKKTKDGSTSEDKKLVSINDASLEELMTLSGIGESKAKAIIEYRNKKKFATVEEIKQVSGIGDALYEKIKDYITT